MNKKIALAAIAWLAFSACNDPTPTPTPSPSQTQTGGGTGGPPAVLTYHNDLMRDGQNQDETILTRNNVNSTDFGKIGALPVDGLVYAQPLYVPNVVVSGTTHNIVYVVTENDSVYAFDADTLSTTPLWQRNMTGDAGWTCPNPPCTVPTAIDVGAPNITPNLGITATPVIDQTNGIIYLTAFTKENGAFYWRLHALNLATGAEISGSPTPITGAVPGTGEGSDPSGIIAFNPIMHLSRSGLVLSNGQVMVAFSSMDDQVPTHGWVFGFNATNLSQTAAFVTSATSGEDNIWMAGGAPAVDASGNIYFSTSNGDPAYDGTTSLQTSVVKLSLSTTAGFTLEDYFTPFNYKTLTDNDVEIGSGGVLLLPDQPGATPHLAVAGGKEGTIYLLNRDNMGKLTTSQNGDPQIVQELFDIVPGGQDGGAGMYGTMAYFDNKIFLVDSGDYLRSIPISEGLLDWASTTTSTIQDTVRGATPSISANGSSNGIVWYLDASAYTYSWDGVHYAQTVTNGPAILHAFSTDSLTTPLYSSNSVAADAAGDAVKFAVPTVVAGKVFVGTQTELSVYGLRSDVASRHMDFNGRAIASVKQLPKLEFPLTNFRVENSCPLHPFRKEGALF